MICNDCGSYVDKLYQLIDGDTVCWHCLNKYIIREWADDILFEFKDEILDYLNIMEIK